MAKNPSWPFSAPPNVAVFTSKRIVSGDAWIHYVSHDQDDGAWQFHSVEHTSEREAPVVSLANMVRKDPTLLELADLPLGGVATREGPGKQWVRRQR